MSSRKDAVDECVEYLAKNATVWTDNAQPEYGVRLIELSGDVLREIMRNGTMEQVWTLFQQKLPRDAVIMNQTGTPIILQKASHATYCDAHYIMVGSTDWEPLKYGESIPVLDIWFDRAEFERAATGLLTKGESR